MGSVILFNAARMQEIEDNTIVSGLVDVSGNLILERNDGTTLDAGHVVGPQGAPGVLPSFNIVYKTAASVPSSYAVGISVMSVGVIDDWPSSVSSVVTTRYGSNRTVQEFFVKTTGRTLIRTETDGDVWGAWVETSTPATNAETIAGSNNVKAVTPASLVAALDLLPLTRNPLLNSDFSIWQRGTSFTGFASATYTADRWMCRWDGTGATRTITRQTFTPGAAPVAGYEGESFYRYTQSVAGTGATLLYVAEQRMEDVRTLAGKTVTVSWWAKADAARNLTCALVQVFGSGGSASISINAVPTATSTAWVRYSATITLGSMSGKTIGTDSYLMLRFVSGTLNVTQTWDIWGVQIDEGTVAQPYRRQNRDPSLELAACRRYCYQIDGPGGVNNVVGMGFSASGTVHSVVCPLPTKMRTIPTLSFAGTASQYAIRSSASLSCTALALSGSTTYESGVIDATVASGLTSGDGGVLRFNATNLWVRFEAEL